MKVLNVSTIFNRGGAGKIAAKLHNAYLHRGLDSTFLFGYGRGGRLENHEEQKEVVTASKIHQPYLNYLLFRFLNYDYLSSIPSKLEELVVGCDIVHMHVIHSYGFNLGQLIGAINKHEKPVVITLHDSWFFTGRCAVTAGCGRWKEGCYSCPSKNNYPPVFIDRAKHVFKSKRDIVNSVEKLTLVSPSEWVFNDAKFAYPARKIVKIPNGINVDLFSGCIDKTEVGEIKKINILFVTNDFGDKEKFDYGVLTTLSNIDGVHMHLVGKNFNAQVNNLTYYGYVSDAQRLASIYGDSDIMIFLSQVDNYPTVLIEALCSGLFVLSKKSNGAAEILAGFDFRWINEGQDLIGFLVDKEQIDHIKSEKFKSKQSALAVEKYSDKKMIGEYVKLLECACKE